MKKLCLLFSLAATGLVSAAINEGIVVTSAAMRQDRLTRKVLIDYTFTNTDATTQESVPAYVQFDILTNGTDGAVSIGRENIRTVSGDISFARGSGTTAELKQIAPGTRQIVWDARHDWPDQMVQNCQLQLTFYYTNEVDKLLRTIGPHYRVFDLADCDRSSLDAVPSVISFEPPDVADTANMTSKLWMRYCPPGTFRMGSTSATDTYNANQVHKDSEQPHQVTIENGFYIGLFELTRAQVARISTLQDEKDVDSLYPYNQATPLQVRGNWGWPEDKSVTADSLIGVLRARTGFAFDLPTEAQWEYACRAGTESELYTGNKCDNAYKWSGYNSDAALVQIFDLAWTHENSYVESENSYSIQFVGQKQPNDWMLYDMYGNVCEYCLDWLVVNNSADAVSGANGGDGPSSDDPNISRVNGSKDIVVRGGAYNDTDVRRFRSAARRVDGYDINTSKWNSGYRLVIRLN